MQNEGLKLNGVEIGHRPDGYLNGTRMCQAAGKLWANYWRNQQTQEFVGELSSVMRIRITELAQVRQGGTPAEQGTWVHPDLAVHLATWLSPKFAVQVTRWVRELLTAGTVSIVPPPAPTLAPYTNRLLRFEDARGMIPRGFWSVLSAGAHLLIGAEALFVRLGLPLDADDLLDGSVGTRWAKFREDKPWAGERQRYAYVFPPPGHRAGLIVEPWCYPNAERGHFGVWLDEVYPGRWLPAYIGGKFGDGNAERALPVIQRVFPHAQICLPA